MPTRPQKLILFAEDKEVFLFEVCTSLIKNIYNNDEAVEARESYKKYKLVMVRFSKISFFCVINKLRKRIFFAVYATELQS